MLISLDSTGQTAVVTHVIGRVMHKGKVLKIRDHLDLRDSMLSNDKNAEVGLLTKGRGRVFLRFDSGKAILQQDKEKHSELFRLLISDAIRPYTEENILTHRGTFDLVSFFTDTAFGNPVHILLIRGQGLPLISENARISESDQYYLCSLADSKKMITLRRSRDSLYFPEHLPYGKNCRLMVRYQFQGKKVKRLFPISIYINVIDPKEIGNLAAAFEDEIDGYYAGDKDHLRDDIYKELYSVYGNFHSEAIDRFIH